MVDTQLQSRIPAVSLASRESADLRAFKTQGSSGSTMASQLDCEHEEGRTPRRDAKPEAEGKGDCWAARYTLALLGFLGLAVEYSLRVNLSIAIVAMAGTSEVNATTNASQDVCPVRDNGTDSGGNHVEGEFAWNEETQGLILGAFFYGYTATNFLGGRLAEYFGGRLVFGLGSGVASVLALLSPLCARISTGLFVASRVLTGVSQGFTYPALNSLMATWFPPEERAKLGSFVYGGMQFGTIIGLTLSGWLCNSGFLGGWPSVFYVFGGVGLAWGVPWFLLIHDRPEGHPRISKYELDYIQGQQDTVKGVERVSIPWKAVLTSPPMWSSAIMAFGGNFGFYTLLTEMPTYLANIQHFNVKSNGLLSGLPYACMLCTSLAWGVVVDRLLAAKCLSLKAVRRISTAIAFYVAALALIAMCFVDCNSSVAMVVLCISVGISGCAYSGSCLTELDIAPNLAGTLTGITNTLGSATGFLAPAIAGAITMNNNKSIHAWREVFLMSAGILTVATSLYMVLMSVDVQPWNNPEKIKVENKLKIENGFAHDSR
ncbi:LOW QUALITY PROTEIN: sialin-like [Penaeus monodon]|uniref:LOW QUALITY PROTEIN: sialin-like n=1 Tax=Penaeus monodon TaxID=6687 RepID=UPI0018A792A9|nr:LOW QUALITY PROTEIN: sialin-like [Penaeus monodon]